MLLLFKKVSLKKMQNHKYCEIHSYYSLSKNIIKIVPKFRFQLQKLSELIFIPPKIRKPGDDLVLVIEVDFL